MPDRIQRARAYVESLFAQLGVEEQPYYETILIRDGHYCGHRFACGDVSAVWFCEEDQVKLYDADRQLIRVANVADEEIRRAA